MKIQKLKYVEVREIWRREADDFTNWLADNIDYLSDYLGLSLNVLETERTIGSFNVDIFGEDEHGNIFLIENQLEKTDHTHLGQLLSYSVGSDAKTVIWVSPDPREEHIAVMEWLNEVTPADMRWYLMKLEVVRTGDHQASPLFTRVAGPSLEAKARGSEKRQLAERQEKRIRFWEGLLPVLAEHTNRYRNISPSADNWLAASTGVSGISYQIVIRMQDASLRLVLEKTADPETNKRAFDFLYGRRDAIERDFGDTMVWRRMEDRISSRIEYDIPEHGLQDEEQWEATYEVISESFSLWEQAFDKHIAELARTNLS